MNCPTCSHELIIIAPIAINKSTGIMTVARVCNNCGWTYKKPEDKQE